MSPTALWVVIPARNEAPRIGAVLDGLRGLAARIFVVDDGSTDATAEVVTSSGDSRVRLLRHERSRGVGAAIAGGMLAATREVEDRPDLLVAVMAGDGQMDPADLPALCGALASPGIAVAWGNRFGGSSAHEMPRDRAFAIRVLSLLTRWASGDCGLKDSQCGYVVFRASVARRVDWTALHPTYGYPNDLAIRLAREGLRVRHVPVRAVYRGEPSGIRPLRDLPRIGWILLRGLCERVWGQGQNAFRGGSRCLAQVVQVAMCAQLLCGGFAEARTAALTGGLVLLFLFALCGRSDGKFPKAIRRSAGHAAAAEPLGRSGGS